MITHTRITLTGSFNIIYMIGWVLFGFIWLSFASLVHVPRVATNIWFPWRLSKRKQRVRLLTWIRSFFKLAMKEFSVESWRHAAISRLPLSWIKHNFHIAGFLDETYKSYKQIYKYIHQLYVLSIQISIQCLCLHNDHLQWKFWFTIFNNYRK